MLQCCVSNSTGPLADRYPGGKNGECGAPGFEHRVGFFPQLPAAAVPVSLAPGFVAGRVEEENQRRKEENRLQGNVLRRAALWAGSSAGSFRLFCSSLRFSSGSLLAALPPCKDRGWYPIFPLFNPPSRAPPLQHYTYPGRARGRGPQLASGLAWKRLSPCWRELGLASSRMLKLAFSLDK